MTSSMQGALYVLVFVVLFTGVQSFCPRSPARGIWEEDERQDRCILRCEDGYEPSGCHIIRYIRGEWNHDIPICEKKSLVSGKTLAAVGVGAAAVAAAPVALAAAGFGATGVVAGSIAAMLQAPFTAAGSWFALSQSAGVLGLAGTTKAVVGGATGTVTYMYYASSLFSNCENE